MFTSTPVNPYHAQTYFPYSETPYEF
jgi:hypothetical protein